MDLREAIRSAARSAGVSVTDPAVQQLSRYYELLLIWNHRVNLTALQLDGYPKATIDRLLIEPLIAAQLVADDDSDVLDLGSGGGSPAIPLKVARPRIRLTMVEARQKKTSFLREVARQLALENTLTVDDRIESMTLASEYRASIVTIRALRIDRSILDRIGTWLQPSARFLLFGGTDPVDPRLSKVDAVDLPGTGQKLGVWRWTDHRGR